MRKGPIHGRACFQKKRILLSRRPRRFLERFAQVEDSPVALLNLMVKGCIQNLRPFSARV